MSGGTQLTSRVSAVLRQAGLPVLRYSARIASRGWSGIRVGNAGRGTTGVSIYAYVSDLSDDRDTATELEWSDKARAVLIAAGFDVSRIPGKPALVVRARDTGAQVEEDVEAVVDGSGLDISQPSPSEWHVAVDGKRARYVIKRTGTRFAVHANGYGNELVGGLRTMAAAIEVVVGDLKEKP